ncbi:MAG: putative sugar O-methyltransferase [Parachlamydiales bacterium]|jgi:putative sugar O-methyltransferase
MAHKFNGTWLPERVYSEYRPACIDLSKDLTDFKRNIKYIGVVGNDTRNHKTALAFYKYIEQHYPELLKIKSFLQNDTIGNPIVHEIVHDYTVSAGTLRFIKVIGDIFIDVKTNWNIPYAKNIVEIGAGYGGQALLIMNYLNDINYTCIDIPEASQLQKNYLNQFVLQKPVNFQTTENVIEAGYDLVISDYCLSELDISGVDFYYNIIIKHSNYCYFTINKASPVRTYLLTVLSDLFNIIIEPEMPETSKHPNEILFCSKKK